MRKSSSRFFLVFILVFTFCKTFHCQSIASVDTCACPVEGNAKSVHLRELNTLKNRSNLPAKKDIDSTVTLAQLLKAGDDKHRWSNKSAAKITGYVSQVKPGGMETTNCKSKDKNLRDTHIEIVLTPMTDGKNKSLIIEITPRIRKIMADKGIDWSTATISKKYLGRFVEVEGWLLFDLEHANMAENTNPGNIKNWRGTAWEIHPVTDIKIAEKH